MTKLTKTVLSLLSDRKINQTGLRLDGCRNEQLSHQPTDLNAYEKENNVVWKSVKMQQHQHKKRDERGEKKKKRAEDEAATHRREQPTSTSKSLQASKSTQREKK